MVAQARGKERTSARRTAPVALFSAHQDARRWELTERETLLHTPEHAPSTIAAHFAAEIGTTPVSLDQDPPEQALAQLFPFHRAQTLRVCPWRQVGGQTVLLASDPDRARAALPSCRAAFGDVRIAITDPRTLDQAFATLYRSAHQIHAETATPAAMSCRNLSFGLRLPFAMTLLAIAVLTAPQTVFAVLATIAILSLLPLTLLKLLALILLWRQRHPPSVDTVVLPARLPVITLLVPLFHERKIAAHLIQRLQRLDYPRPLTDIVLLLEEDDRTTRAALAAANLPRWMRLITVPPGTIQTKPRALNHGLTYARGSIIGIYDAEDAPEPDQLHQVARAFAAAPPDVACTQGILDFYNSRDNWLSRCFTLEYAVWFRAVLPALARIGWVVPLGGTTLFFRRAPLEKIGGWDAHNVTEDADLGLRLARFGYRTALLPSVTFEEANCRPWPWVRQRSRWLKGYTMTYATHMRRPIRLWRALGAWKFLGVQVLFLGTILQFGLAPLLWSFWLLTLGLPHPLAPLVTPVVAILISTGFLLSEVISIALAASAASRAGHSHLLHWAPTLHLYFPLAALAMYKGLWEMISRPFYWDKTSHGHSMNRAAPSRRVLQRQSHRV